MSLQDSHSHSAAIKRRSSLDNSCLAACDSFHQVLPEEHHNYSSPKHRRLSLDHRKAVNANFLASADGSENRPKLELDLDLHSSMHSKTSPSRHSYRASLPSKLTNSESSNETFETVDTENDADIISDEYSLDSCSGCDSFGEASVHELANKDYLRNNLGESVFWASNASLSGDLKYEIDMADVVMEEGDEGL